MADNVTIDRVVPCQLIFNFRDYGGYDTPYGQLRQRHLYRSAQHFEAMPGDRAVVGALGLGAVIDLRGKNERTAAPCPRPDGFDAEVVLVEDDTAAQAPHITATGAKMTADEARGTMVKAYRTMPFRPMLMHLYTQYFARLAELDRPTLIHCLAGKDRTGIAVALFHHMVGVHYDDLMSDYLMTNVTSKIEARVQAGGRDIKALFGDLDDNALRALMSVEPIYLQNAFTAMVERYGSIDLYISEGIGVTRERREQIVARVTA